MHKFKVGELVRIKSGQATQLRGVYEIVRLLPPNEAGTFMYHVKSAEEDHLRMVAEQDIERSTSSNALKGP